jgi:hypothetical protein
LSSLSATPASLLGGDEVAGRVLSCTGTRAPSKRRTQFLSSVGSWISVQSFTFDGGADP